MMHTPAHRDYRDHRRIYDLSMEFMDPPSSELAMRRSLKSKQNFQDKILLKDKMMCLRNIGTNEVQCLAVKISKKISHNKENIIDRIIKFIMNIKVEDIKKDVEAAREKSIEDKQALNEVINPNTVAASEYKYYVNRELEMNWKRKKEKMKSQVEHLKDKIMKKTHTRP